MIQKTLDLNRYKSKKKYQNKNMVDIHTNFFTISKQTKIKTNGTILIIKILKKFQNETTTKKLKKNGRNFLSNILISIVIIFFINFTWKYLRPLVSIYRLFDFCCERWPKKPKQQRFIERIR